MSTDPKTNGSRESSRPRFHFSLKAAFLVVTLVALWLGYAQIEKRREVERQRDALKLAGRLQAIEFAVQKLLMTPPLETAFIAPGHPSSDWFYAGPADRESSVRQDAQWLSAGRSAETHIRLELTLDTSQALDVTTAWGVRKRLLRHYETNLAEHGLRRVSGRDGVSDANAVELWSIWMSKKQNPSATVYITVEQAEDSSQATVNVLMTAQASLD